MSIKPTFTTHLTDELSETAQTLAGLDASTPRLSQILGLFNIQQQARQAHEQQAVLAVTPKSVRR